MPPTTKSKSAAGIVTMPSGAAAAGLVDSISTIFCGMACHTFDNDCSEHLVVLLHLRKQRIQAFNALPRFPSASTAP